MCPRAAVFFPLNPLRADRPLVWWALQVFQHLSVIRPRGGHMLEITVTWGGRLVFTLARSESTCHQPECLLIRRYWTNHRAEAFILCVLTTAWETLTSKMPALKMWLRIKSFTFCEGFDLAMSDIWANQDKTRSYYMFICLSEKGKKKSNMVTDDNRYNRTGLRIEVSRVKNMPSLKDLYQNRFIFHSCYTTLVIQ